MVGVEAMANWKRLTSPSGDTIYLNLDVMIGMQRNPDINITFLQSVSEPSVKIEVRETPDEILSIRATKVRFNRFGSLAIFAAIRALHPW